MRILFLLLSAFMLGGCFMERPSEVKDYSHLLSREAKNLEHKLQVIGTLPDATHNKLREKHLQKLGEAKEYYSGIIDDLQATQKKAAVSADRTLLDLKKQSRSAENTKDILATIKMLNLEKAQNQRQYSEKIKNIRVMLKHQLNTLNDRYLQILEEDYASKK
jgi:hypothetical protein